MDTIVQDIRYALRILRRQRWFAVTAVLSLAIGLGADSTIAVIAHALLLQRPPGVDAPDRLVDIAARHGGGGFNASYPDYLDIRDRSTTLAGVYASELIGPRMSLHVDGAADDEVVFANVVTSNYFAVLGVPAAAGRTFTTGSAPAAEAILSHRFWLRRFGGDPSIVGRTVLLDRHAFTIVGVAPEGFHGTRPLAGDVWLPLSVDAGTASAPALAARASAWLVVGGRLKPGVSIERASSEMATIGRQREREHPDENRGLTFEALPMSPLPGASTVVAVFLALLMAIATLVLVVACANVVNATMARGAARHHEIGVRLALGSGRGRLVRQFLTESVVLFALASVGALVIAREMALVIRSTFGALPFPIDVSFGVSLPVAAFTGAIALPLAIATAIVPAAQAAGTDILSALARSHWQPPSRLRLRNLFVIVQVATSVTAIVTGGLFVRALQRAGAGHAGFDPRGVELATFELPLDGRSEIASRQLLATVLERVRALPDAPAAAVARTMPGGFEQFSAALRMPDSPAPLPDVQWNIVSPSYFATLRIPIVSGRALTVDDRGGAPPVVLVAASTARRLWPGRSPIGQQLIQQLFDHGRPAGTRTLDVVGVAGDVTAASLVDGVAANVVYVPLDQHYGDPPAARFILAFRSTSGRRIAADVRNMLVAAGLALPGMTLGTLDDAVALGQLPQRSAAFLATVLGIIGVVLAAFGVYGVAAYVATMRTREIGIRLALGAPRRSIVVMIVGQGMRLTGVGCAIGLLMALGLGRAVATLLFGVAPFDLTVSAAACAAVALLAAMACWGPSAHAARTDPVTALRAE